MYDAAMEPPLPDSVPEVVVSAARATVGLEVLILFGSRARGDARPGADWDFGYLADEAADVPGLLSALVENLEDDHVDLVDLRRASGLLRYRAACDGRLVHEATDGLFRPVPPRSGAVLVRERNGIRAGLRRGPGGPAAVSVLDRPVLAERTMIVERHLTRVAEKLPASPVDFEPATDTSDAVVLHLWQATQIVIDVAMSACLALRLGTPHSYADAFRRLEKAGVIETALTSRLVRARAAGPTGVTH